VKKRHAMKGELIQIKMALAHAKTALRHARGEA
jgi:hypothetical protein